MAGSSPPRDSVPRKRQRVESLYPRRRSVTACMICRTRKTKCDNVRPSCGFCLCIGAQCSYEETRSDFSNYDSASLHIIDRLERLGEQMEQGFNKISDTRYVEPAKEPKTPCMTSAPIPIVERILEWPVFEDLNLELQGRSLALIHEFELNPACDDSGMKEYNRQDPPPDENGCLTDFIDPCILSFIVNVHSKNPILEPERLWEAAEHCSNGFKNNGLSALVAIACALGTAAHPYTSSTDMCGKMWSIDENWTDGQLSTGFFTKAREILSLLPPSLLKIQCLFFCGVYEMYSIQPVAAWLYFSQASLQLKMHLLSNRPFAREQSESPRGRLMQRLYWSCMQSESELANELRMKSSGLEDLPFPHAFPSPPETTTYNNPTDQTELRSWMYYLSETSLRRICNEVVWTMYDQSPSSWLNNISSLQSHAERLEQKVEAWMANLPPILTIQGRPSDSSCELGLHIRSRYMMCRTWIYQPFLYFLIHAPHAALAAHRKDVEPLAYTCLEACIDSINDVTIHHRHHGTWYILRVVLGSALILLAAAKIRFVSMPPDWRDAVERALWVLKHWSAGCKNLQASVDILEKLRMQVG